MFVYLALFTLLMIPSTSSLIAQDRRPGDKPVLIRDEVTKRDAEEEKVYPHDPEAAKENLEIGDFYFKRDNFPAAEQRYREAVNYNRHWPEAWEKLVEALSRQSNFEAAIEICEDFIRENPESDEIEEFNEKKTELQAKATEARR